MNASPDPDSSAQPRTGIAEVKFSLPDMLEELKIEREASVFAMEKLDRDEIAKLFKDNAPRAKA